jgi:serine/threonine protein phosphatase PrpC
MTKHGEDAYFASSTLLVVADGVGAWITQGVNSGHYSRELVKNAKNLFRSDLTKFQNNPELLLKLSADSI